MAKSWRYPTGKPQSEKEHTVQWPTVGDTQRVNHKARKNIQYNGQKLEIPKGASRSCKSKKERRFKEKNKNQSSIKQYTEN